MRELSKILFVAEDSFANGSPAIHFLPLYSPYREYFADANEERSIEHAACHHELKPRDEERELSKILFVDGVRPLNADLFAYLSNFVGYNGPEINDERRCTYVQHKERELVKILFVAEDSFANGSPAIHFLPLYSP
ncbi:unnamed protein product [Clonostachys rosea f. rosea IK726]|uniref:Uncharacterized protein n=1 Tax=Clonostachys rosea f. rosea IK726 TaxID=1349383 RepID=A0ACA9USB6_BIOOC|nr:unnamed protein product [Clonostachys rosea f. rosea IK726]